MGCGASSPQSRDEENTTSQHKYEEQKDVNEAKTIEKSKEELQEQAKDQLDAERVERMMQANRRTSLGTICTEPSQTVVSVKRGWARVKASVFDHIRSKKDAEAAAVGDAHKTLHFVSKKQIAICNSWLKEVHEAGADTADAEIAARKSSMPTTVSYLDAVLTDGPPELPSLTQSQGPAEKLGSKSASIDDGAQSLSEHSLASFFCASVRSGRSSLNSMMSSASRTSRSSQRGANGLSTMKLANGSSIMMMRKSPQLQPPPMAKKKRVSAEGEATSSQGSQSAGETSSHRRGQSVDDMDALLYGGSGAH